MKIKKLIEILRTLPQEKNLYFSNDEEMNNVFKDFQIVECDDLTEIGKSDFVLLPLEDTHINNPFDNMSLEELERELKKRGKA